MYCERLVEWKVEMNQTTYIFNNSRIYTVIHIRIKIKHEISMIDIKHTRG